MNKITICIPTYKRPLMLKKLILSIIACNIDQSIMEEVSIIVVDNAKLYTDEARIKFGTEDNGGLGYLITAVDTTTNTLTIEAPGLANPIADDDVVAPWLPTPVITGNMVSGVLGTATLDSSDILISNAVFELTNNFKVITDEKSGLYPVSIVRPNKRTVTITYEQLLRNDTGETFVLARNQTPVDVVLPVGDVVGSKYEFQMVQGALNTPDITGEEELRLANTGDAFATVAYDVVIPDISDSCLCTHKLTVAYDPGSRKNR